MTTSNIKGNRTDKAAFSRTITFETEERLRFPTTDRALDPKVTGENRNVDSKSIRLKKIGPKLQSL